MEEVKKVVLSLSGGLDSTCLALKYLSEGKTVHAISFKYGQKHAVELKKVKKNIAFLQKLGLPIEHEVIDLTSVFAGNTSALVASTGEAIPQGHYAADNMKSTVVPLRNVIFSTIVYSKAINWAVRDSAPVMISLGVHSGDHFIYPDCRPESQEAVRTACELSDDNSDKVTYEAPFIDMYKGEVLAAGIEAMKAMDFTKAQIKRVLKNTHTCYDPDDKGRACGKCGSCTERLESFESLGMKDPAEYVE